MHCIIHKATRGSVELHVRLKMGLLKSNFLDAFGYIGKTLRQAQGNTEGTLHFVQGKFELRDWDSVETIRQTPADGGVMI